jgi:hypothetical protein
MLMGPSLLLAVRVLMRGFMLRLMLLFDKLRSIIIHANLAFNEPFDRVQVGPLFGIAKRNRMPARARACGAADAVHVRLGLMRQVVVEHVRDVIDIDAARRDITGNQNRRLARLEVRQRSLPRVLRLVPVNRLRTDARLVKLPHYAIGAMLRPRKHERP